MVLWGFWFWFLGFSFSFFLGFSLVFSLGFPLFFPGFAFLVFVKGLFGGFA